MSVVTGFFGERLEWVQAEAEWDGRTASMIIGGELDYATAPILAACLDEVIAGQPGRLILDMARVTFIDCAGLSPILQARNRLPAGASLIVRSPGAAVRMLFKIANVDLVCERQE